MNERITFICKLNDTNLKKIEFYTNQINEKLCKVPFGKNVEEREKSDTLPYHFTIFSWNINKEEEVLEFLEKISFSPFKVFVEHIEVVKGNENSYELRFCIKNNRSLYHIQNTIFLKYSSKYYIPNQFSFHITLHVDKNYKKILAMKDILIKNFTPFELEVDTLALYEIWPAKLIRKFPYKICDEEYEEIAPTALVTSYSRTFTDIPYEKDIYKWLCTHCEQKTSFHKNIAPEIEARYKLTNKLLNKFNKKQILELGAGYSSRGLIYSEKGYGYVELDLELVSKKKQALLKSLVGDIPNNLHIISGNVLRREDFFKALSYFQINDEIAVIHEGLLRYLTFEEKKLVAQNIYDLLAEFGGIWITCDLTPKKFLESQNQAHQNFNQNISEITSRNHLNDRFEDEAHIREFFGQIGFELLEIHKFSEMKDELYSVNQYGIMDSKISKTLDDAIAVVMKVK